MDRKRPIITQAWLQDFYKSQVKSKYKGSIRNKRNQNVKKKR
jgi:hypothetical protein